MYLYILITHHTVGCMEELLNRLRAVAERTRLRLLHVLSRNELTVSEITAVLDQSQPRISRHLKILCDAGLLARTQEGASVFYRCANDAAGADLTRHLLAALPLDDQLQRDLVRLEEIKRQHAAAAAQYFKAHADEWERIRALYLADPMVEQAMLAAAGMDIGHFLDVGTGTGSILKLFGDRVQRGLGIDSSREMLALARTNLEAAGLTHCEVRKGDIRNLPVETESMDVVTIHHVLHFLDDPAQAVMEAVRALKPGGRLLIVDFARHHIEPLRIHYAHRRLGFDDAEILKWCGDAGLVHEQTRAWPGTVDHQVPRPDTKLWVFVRAA